MKNKLVILLAGLLLVLPALAWGQRAGDSIIVESKTVRPGLTGMPAFSVRVSITNVDSLTYMVLACTTRTVSGGGYALLNRTATGALTYGSIVNNLTGTLKFFTAASVASYNDGSPDAFLVAGGFDGSDPATIEPPNASQKAVWELKFRSSSTALGEMLITSGTVSGQVSAFVNTRPADISVNFARGILTVSQPLVDNPPPNDRISGNAGTQIQYTFVPSGSCGNLRVISGPGGFLGPGNTVYTITTPGLCGGSYPVTIEGDCGPAGALRYSFTVVVAPVTPNINCPGSTSIQANSAYNANATASGGVGPYAFALVSGPSGLTVSSSGAVSWTPSAAQAGSHPVTIRVTDACNLSSECTYNLSVVVGQAFQLVLDKVDAGLGADVNVYIRNEVAAADPTLANGISVGGFEFLVSYDCTGLQFLSATRGQLLMDQGWEFFTFRIASGSCLVRVVAIADVNNGQFHPRLTRQNMGTWVCLKFRTTGDRAFAGQCLPVNWFWNDCTDNTVSDSTGNTTWVVNELTSTSHNVIPLNNSFPNDVSNCDRYQGGQGSPKKFINFRNGHVCLPDPGTLSSLHRGDINLNGLAYESGDATLFENYFIYGAGVFNSNPSLRADQIEASDVNGDQQVLTVADLVTLIRVLTGDMAPLPKTIPADWTVDLAMTNTGSRVTLSANSGTELGGLYLKFQVDGAVGTPELVGAASGMTVKSNQVGSELSVLIYSESKGVKIDANAGAVLRMPVEGNIELVESDAASYFGAVLPTVSKVSARSTTFALSQNYPNPFNGRTSLVLALPVASDYTITVYNVAGQVVRSFEGSAPAGNRFITWDGTDNHGKAVSSGIYFFKAAAGSYSAVKRGLYLK